MLVLIDQDRDSQVEFQCFFGYPAKQVETQLPNQGQTYPPALEAENLNH